MQDISREILAHYQVRKRRADKDRFLDFLKSQGIEGTVEEKGGFPNCKNYVVGDPATAKVLITAHYDTCARMPVPNIVFPKSVLLSLLYGVLLAVPFVAVMLGAQWVLSFIPVGPLAKLLMDEALMLLMLGALLFMTMGPIANRHTANDNTSGVVTLVELIRTLSPEQREKVAFVFFDHEENGLLGSAYYRKRHRAEIAGQLIVNLDCVSDGDHLLVYAKNADAYRLYDIFESGDGATVHYEKRAFYPSDQMGFPRAVALSFFKKGRLGLYMTRIHTDRDTVFEEKNIDYLCAGLTEFLTRLS